MKKRILAFILLSGVPLFVQAGVAHQPTTHPRISGLAVLCIPHADKKPLVVQKTGNSVTLDCKPENLHLRGIAAAQGNQQLLYAGQGLTASIRVYRLQKGMVQ